MAVVAGRIEHPKLRLFDAFSVALMLGIALIIGTTCFIVDRAVVTDDELRARLADHRFDHPLPEGLETRAAVVESDRTVLLLDDRLATSRTFARVNAEVVIAYHVHPSPGAAARRFRAEERSFDPRRYAAPWGCPRRPGCAPPIPHEPLAVGLQASCGERAGLGGVVECTYLRDNVTVYLSSRLVPAREGGPSHIHELSRAALAHLKEAE